MSTPEQKTSWAISLRHLAASRFYLPLAEAEADSAWSAVGHYLHHKEFGLALDEAVGLGSECEAPREYWTELLLAADNMQYVEQLQAIRARL
jgi:hypothetical protein